MAETREAAANKPFWGTTPQEVFCPLCGYNVWGLDSPRCPECGYRFAWEEVLDPRRRKHPYLFEHHPERNVVSWLQTFRGALRPKTFWTTLHPVQQSYPGRMLAYWLVGLLPYLLMILFLTALECIQEAYSGAPGRPGSLLASAQGRDELWAVISDGLQRGIHVASIAFWVMLPMVWVPLTCLGLFLYWISMRRARIRRVHIVRAVLYCFDPAAWMLFASMAAALNIAMLFLTFLDINWLLNSSLLLAAWLFCVYRLTCAYRLYLRFDHPWLTVLSSQVVALLLLVNMWALLDPWGMARWLRGMGVY